MKILDNGKRTYDLNDKADWITITDEHGKNFDDLRMIAFDDDGVLVNFSRYPAGYYKPAHRHSCSHGIYVISGKMQTDHGVYGPGSFVWHPAGCVASHGATADEDCTFLFIANKNFDIEYIDD